MVEEYQQWDKKYKVYHMMERSTQHSKMCKKKINILLEKAKQDLE